MQGNVHHFALSCLYFVCWLNAQVIVDCLKDGDVPSVALVVVFPRWENYIGWLCFRCRCMFVVLPHLVVTFFLQQMRYTGLSRLSGLPHCSWRVRLWNEFHLCFYSIKSQLALPLACYSSRSSHAALSVMSGAGSRLITQRQRVTHERVYVRDTGKTN